MPALSIVPDDDVLEAQLLVPARAIGFVAAGQTVHISYDTFPFQQFGFARYITNLESLFERLIGETRGQLAA